jgi:2-oxoglutarate/2-oxoacid ferredoxin oxidoreductase subunit beta
MTFIRPNFRHPDAPVNSIGFTEKDYEGSISTLCAGCGHDSISAAIIQACFELAIEPHRIAKISGIGCSSKTPTYFLGQSHGFNSVHGRMPSITTGANLANRDLIYLGVSGDGDSASIGLGQFAHVVRRNLNMLYITENNGCYGLTKGQNSATTDLDSRNKAGIINPFEPIDLVTLALQLGATFVARSFSGDKEQLVPLLKAAISHRGFSFIDVISPCVTFNNNPGSMKSYDFVREHCQATSTIDFVPMQQEIRTSYRQGTTQDVTLHDGSVIRLHKARAEFDPGSRRGALNAIRDAEERGEILTGLLYVDADPSDLHDILNTVHRPLAALGEEELCPGNRTLQSINDSLR